MGHDVVKPMSKFFFFMYYGIVIVMALYFSVTFDIFTYDFIGY